MSPIVTDCLPTEDELRPPVDPETGVDLSLIEEDANLTPEQRDQVMADTFSFGNMLRSAMLRRHAAP